MRLTLVSDTVRGADRQRTQTPRPAANDGLIVRPSGSEATAVLIAGRAMPPGLRMPPPSLTSRLKARPVRAAAASVISCTLTLVRALLQAPSGGSAVVASPLPPLQKLAAALTCSGDPQGVVGTVR